MTSELIAEARARLTTRRIGSSIMRETDKDLLVIRRLADALEAHTPTDDEREALARLLDQSVNPQDGESMTNPWWLADAILAAGFRRSVVPEPTVDEWGTQIRAEQSRAAAKGYTAQHDAEHGIRHLLNWAIDYSRQGKAKASSGLILSALDLLDAMTPESGLSFDPDVLRLVTDLRALRASVEPQGEPSDAERYRAAIEDALPMLGLFSPRNVSPEQIENVRVILARAVTEQGENR